MPLHQEQHLDAATIVGSEVPVAAPTVMEWHFDEPQDDWKPVVWQNPTVEVTPLDDALRVTLAPATPATRGPFGIMGGLVLEVPDWDYEDLAYLVVRARTADEVLNLGVVFNQAEGNGTNTGAPLGFENLAVIDRKRVE